MERRVGFVGAGNIASALVRAAVERGVLSPDRITAINKENRARMQSLLRLGVHEAPSLRVLAAECPIIVICVKPHQVAEVLRGLVGAVTPDHLMISVAAGISIASIHSVLGDLIPVIRSMPNTPVQVGEGVVGLTSAPPVSEAHHLIAETLLSPVGKVFWVDEGKMDVITALSGSGPAYFYRLAEKMAEAARRMGLDPVLASELSRQTLVGAGHLLKQSPCTVTELLRQVTSPNGTTEAALRALEAGGFDATVQEAMARAAARSEELGRGN